MRCQSLMKCTINPSYQYRVYIMQHLSHYNRFKDYQKGYPEITKIRKRLGISNRNWDDMLAGSKNIPLETYKQTLEFLRKLEN